MDSELLTSLESSEWKRVLNSDSLSDEQKTSALSHLYISCLLSSFKSSAKNRNQRAHKLKKS